MIALSIVFTLLSASRASVAQELRPIKLNPPGKKRGLPLMETLAVKASAREWSEKELSLQDLSDLLWAASGLNRPEEDKTTASSAQNAHDVDIYLFTKRGIYVYDFRNHQLTPCAQRRLSLVRDDAQATATTPRSPWPRSGPRQGGCQCSSTATSLQPTHSDRACFGLGAV